MRVKDFKKFTFLVVVFFMLMGIGVAYAQEELDPTGKIILAVDDMDLSPWVSVSYDTGYYYENAPGVQSENITIHDKTYITLDGFDWNEAQSYYVSFQSGDCAYIKEITKNDVGSILNVENDPSKYGELEIEIPFAKSNLNIESIDLYYFPDGNTQGYKPIDLMGTHNHVKIPYGSYNMHIKAYDDEYTYSLFVKDCMVDSPKFVVQVDRSDVSKVDISVDYGEHYDMSILYAYSTCREGFGGIGGISSLAFEQIRDFKGIYVTKINDSLGLALKTDDGWTYSFDCEEFDAYEDTAVKFDLDFKARIELYNDECQTGAPFPGNIGVYDGNGNRLTSICSPSWANVGGYLKFESHDSLVEDYYCAFDYLGYIEAELPENEGAYSMEVTVGSNPVEIASEKVNIDVKAEVDYPLNEDDINELEYESWETKVASSDKEWKINFSNKVDEYSIKENVFVVDQMTNKFFDVKPVLATDGKTIIVTHELPYSPGSQYALYIGKHIMSQEGQSLGEGIKMRFIITD